ncbi:dihydroxyacetone kinase subunit DhaK [Celeribacter marinus]|uniref:Putative dihydroxyacetone kinase, dihydroxyacetone binding subunit n=1 Tax=Celeribacter marinus TaxID=1397108 RepID=A0A0P0ACX1_9RHOB|nr:dihydroxyacetone kinase subunit DhaK [Celeribacter marinus]ALI56279.1 putative dihydroxyacetone kinase, dihydroxyacetone binding subunit [Celeribacter marinus]SFK83387.1 dihydroxyacetone kinase DhaK subunit [Celeribacter marinus]
MKKFINNPENFVDEMLEGIYLAHPEVTHVGEDLHCYVRTTPVKGKVAIVTGGGSGHLPLFLGYVGDNMLDGAGVGGVFQSPSSEQVLEVTRYVDQGAGVLYLYGNYSGDLMNFDMAGELADLEGIETATVVGRDDVASSVVGEEHKRRGVAGIVFLYKVAGAAASAMKPLAEVVRLTEKASARTRTIGVALSPCIVPEVGKPSFEIGADEMEIGMGIHGEPGITRKKLTPADALVDEMMERVLAEQSYDTEKDVAVLINGLGATPLEELYVIYRRTAQVLEKAGANIRHVFIGEYATSMEMAGASISVLQLDDELEPLIAVGANTPFFKHIAR